MPRPVLPGPEPAKGYTFPHTSTFHGTQVTENVQLKGIDEGAMNTALPCPASPAPQGCALVPPPRAPPNTPLLRALPRHIRRQRKTPTVHYEVQNKTQTMSFCPDRRRPHSPKVHVLLSARDCLPGYWNLVYPQSLPRTHGAEMSFVHLTATYN